ncbi:MAG: twin-arginine translocase TatA/TatE family subunit [Alphaproteobacteria bacterium]|nr:twin-arginine translocase TatA/TatE family subunit [Alphaproteobacteria bacterium]
MDFSFGHILLLVIVVFILFGAGKLPSVMGDLGKGLRNFKGGLKGEDDHGASKSNTNTPSDHHKAD